MILALFTSVAGRHLILAVSCLGLVLSATADPDDYPAFHTGTSDNIIFDTGVVKGSMRKDGRGEGLQPIRFVDPDLQIDTNHGLLVPYRFLTPQKRYGFGSWEWPRSGLVRKDGSAELFWGAAKDRPFHFSIDYRWQSPDTLDAIIKFTAETRLQNFELFLGSYLKNFTKAKAYVKDAGQGQPGFVEAVREQGDDQLFPRGDAVLPMVNDGRWNFPPFPVKWSIRGAMKYPLGMKQETNTGATVLFMSPPQDCFALSMLQQQARLGAFYLSLFGKDLEKNEMAIGHVRLVFGKGITDDDAVKRYLEYVGEVKEASPPGPAHWISPEVPKPDADGWVTLFDGTHLYACTVSDADINAGKIALQDDGLLRLSSFSVNFKLNARNIEMQATVKKVSGQNCYLSVRSGDGGNRLAWFNGENAFGIGKVIDRKYGDLVTTQIQNKSNDFLDMELDAKGENLALNAAGNVLCSAHDPSVNKGDAGICALRGETLFRRIRVRILDPSPTPP